MKITRIVGEAEKCIKCGEYTFVRGECSTCGHTG